MPTLDRANHQILNLVARNGRMTIAEIASRIGRSESTVRDRVASLERDGVIRGYGASIDHGRLGFAVRAWVSAGVDRADRDEVAGALEAVPNVTQAAMVSGERPLVFEVVARDLADLEAVIEARIATLPVFDLDVRVVLRQLVESRPLAAVADPVVALGRRPAPRNGAARPELTAQN